MIIDSLDNLKDYVALNPLFQKVIEFLKAHDLNGLPDGRTVIDGDLVYVNIETVKGKTPEEAVLEYHCRMVDIQVPLSGSETYGYSPCEDLPQNSYDRERDLALVPGIAPQTCFTLRPGQMAIFFPNADGHAPCISQAKTLRKAVFKVRGKE